MGCENNKYTPTDLGVADGYSLTDGPCSNADNLLAEKYAAESLEIAGTPINVFKLLGIHEQGLLIDLTGNGNAISSSTAIGSLNNNAFDDTSAYWESADPSINSWIGYNFGTKKTSTGNERYNDPAPIYQHITTIRIKQGPLSINRVLQIRVEYSNDSGQTWKRADVVNLPNTDNFETIHLRQSTPAQMWRLVPIMSNSSTDPWIVEELELIDYQSTSINNIQDDFLMENRDRDYANNSIQLKAKYDLVDVQTELTKFGIDLPAQYYFTISFNRMIELLGRPIVIGDIIELPSEAQVDQNLNCIQKWLEVTDTTWDPDGYTPAWKPILFKVTAQPLLASQETRDITGIQNDWDNIPDDDFLLNQLIVNNQANKTSENIEISSKDIVPEVGSDTSSIDELVIDDNGTVDPADDEIVNPASVNDFYAEDAIPPNGAPYTEHEAPFPANPNDGDYHRLLYDPSYNLPAKLFRWSEVKHRWIYLETDRRREQSVHKPSVERILQSGTSVPLNKEI